MRIVYKVALPTKDGSFASIYTHDTPVGLTYRIGRRTVTRWKGAGILTFDSLTVAERFVKHECLETKAKILRCVGFKRLPLHDWLSFSDVGRGIPTVGLDLWSQWPHGTLSFNSIIPFKVVK